MPKPKKPAPFMVFVKEYQKKFPTMTLEVAISEADLKWRNMTAEEKSLYKNRAPLAANIAREKYSSQGVPLSQLDKEKQDTETREQQIKREILNMILSGRNSNTLSSQKFYFIMANYFIRNVDGLYLPAEIAVCEYSLEYGITNKFNSLINPEHCKDGLFGHAYEAMEHAKKTHNLPLPPNALGETDLAKIYSEILRFLQSKNCGKKELPPVFTLDQNLPVLKSILNFLQSYYDDETPYIRVYSLHYLFYVLKKTTSEIGDTKQFDSIHITNAILDRDYYEYQSGIACDLHEEINKSNYCALSYVIRWAYTFSDTIGMDLGITIKPGIHVPLDADLTVIPDNDTESILSTCTNFTEPDLEPEFSISLTGEQFQKLGKNTKIKDKNKPDKSVDETVSGIENMSLSRWSERVRNMPREPSDESFLFGFSRGRGRNCLLKYDISDTDSDSKDNIVIPKGRGWSPNDSFASISSKGFGRGRPL